MRAFRRLVALTGALGVLSVGVATSPATAVAAGSLICEGGGQTSGPPQVSGGHGTFLGAAFDFFTVSGTTETDIFIDAIKATATAAGSGASSGSAAFVQISIYDTETGVQSVDALGCVDDPDFQIDKTLTAARLGPTSITLVDSNTNASTTAMVSADWTGIGEISHTTQTSHFHSEGFTNIFNFIGFDRFAEATGTATDPELNVSFSGAATQAGLDNVIDFFIFICPGGC